MRYFLPILALCVLVVMLIAGKRGTMSRETPIYVFPDMKRQLKLRPQTPNDFFPNEISSQPFVAGTVARSRPVAIGDRLVFPYEDSPVFNGRVTGTTNFVENNPFPVTAGLLKRGQQRFNIYCAPCHGRDADGNGITKKLGVMMTVANLHDPRIVKLADGEIFFVITNGRNTMQGYGPNVPVEDRWAIVAYLRAVQLSWLGTIDEVPPEQRDKLKK